MSSSTLGVVDSVWMKAASVVPLVGEFVGLYAVGSMREKIADLVPSTMGEPATIHMYEVCKHYSMIEVARSLIESVACVALVALGFLSPLFGIILSVFFFVLAGSWIRNAEGFQLQISVQQQQLPEMAE